MTIRVVLSSGRGAPLDPPPGRVFLAHADHSFSELAEAIDTAFGRWDLEPVHDFDVEGRRLVLGGGPEDVEDGPEPEDSEDVTLGEVGLRLGGRFTYVFDPVHRWLHDCTVVGVDIDPFDLFGEEPEAPVAVIGWGVLPDQYGRLWETDDPDGEPLEIDDEVIDDAGDPLLEDDELDTESDDWTEDGATELTSWSDAEAETLEIVAEALGDFDREVPQAELQQAVERAREGQRDGTPPYALLWTAAGFDEDEPPAEDEELWLELAAAVVAPRTRVDMEADRAAAWSALEPADWAGAVIELVRAGVGSVATPDILLDLVAACPEVDNDDLTEEDEEVLLAGFETVVTLWQALGILDEEARLTALGYWGLPEVLQVAWSED